MNIAMISSGNSIHVKKIANALATRGYNITLYTLPNHNKLLPDLDRRIEVVKLPFKGKLGYYLNASFIRNAIKKRPVDLVNSHYASGYGTLARLVGRHPLVLAVFGSDVFDYPFRSRWNMRTIIRNLDCADIITSTSQVMADKVRAFYNRDREIYITPFGVDLELFYPRPCDKTDRFEIGIIKKIEAIYGFDVLLHAMKRLIDEYGMERIHLSAYGRGSKAEYFASLAKDMGLEDFVSFCGFVRNEDVPKVLSGLDVACFPSVVDESFGVAIVEAMACGVPVVASDALGFTEVIEDGVTGLIVPQKDEIALAEALYKVYQMSSEERMNMGRAGVERTRKLYNFENNMNEYEEALKKARTVMR